MVEHPYLSCPAVCLACEWIGKNRDLITKGRMLRCPQCRSDRIRQPAADTLDSIGRQA
jgi:predicted Zn-ribbon and HTH transcriptional regulator